MRKENSLKVRQPRYSKEEFARQAIYEQVRAQVEEGNRGKIVAIDIETGEFDKGCDAPDQKCDRNRYKKLLIEAIYAAGTTPRIGGIEYAEEIMQQININRAARVDRSFNRFVTNLRNTFRGWQE